MHVNYEVYRTVSRYVCSPGQFRGQRQSHTRFRTDARQTYVTRIALGLILILPLLAANEDFSGTLKSVENRYNRAKTLQVTFEETYAAQGRGRKTESGELYLRKPGKMRWEYRTPAGKLFVSDGKDVFYYSPVAKQVERMKLKESDDMRAPLAFLLGKLDFDKDFKNFSFRNEGAGLAITAEAKSDKLPYRQVRFLVTPDAQIRKLDITIQDGSTLSFALSNEKVNPALDEKLFRFEMPPGAKFAESGIQDESR
jgi:outer membrane lipoprotein carrier protein